MHLKGPLEAIVWDSSLPTPEASTEQAYDYTSVRKMLADKCWSAGREGVLWEDKGPISDKHVSNVQSLIPAQSSMGNGVLILALRSVQHPSLPPVFEVGPIDSLPTSPMAGPQ